MTSFKFSNCHMEEQSEPELSSLLQFENETGFIQCLISELNKTSYVLTVLAHNDVWNYVIACTVL